MVDRNGVISLALAIVQQAFRDVDGLVMTEYGQRTGHWMKGAILRQPTVNFTEIKAFMTYGFFSEMFDVDGGALLEKYIKYAREEKIPQMARERRR